MSFSTKIVADSKNEFGNRLTTFVITFPRMILAEFNTHRMLSKNSASSRAIPFSKMVEAVETNPFMPLKWMKDHKGMQGVEYFDPEFATGLEDYWFEARDEAVKNAKILSGHGVTKQIVNRLLEPFMWHTVIVTGTEWSNFFGLRCHEAAEIHMQKIAYMMLEEYNKSTPKLLKPGEWHIPFEDQIDNQQLDKLLPEVQPASLGWYWEFLDSLKVKISTVMAARTSYTVVGNDQKPLSYSRMIEIYDEMKNAQPKHMSPFEHCAQAMSKFEMENNYVYGKHIKIPNPEGSLIQNSNKSYGWSGNFRGFIQHRKTIENENIAVDPRVMVK